MLILKGNWYEFWL